MSRKRESKIGLYVHIPFCQRKCQYCDFLSFPSGERERSIYVDALVREMELRDVSASVDTVFVGGGTPSVLETKEMDRVFSGLLDCFDMSRVREFTVECNPGTVTEEKLRLYRQAGVDRISFGLQSAVEKELQLLGRIHTFADFMDSFRLARRCGFENINIDIMSAIPGQTRESYDWTLSQVVALNPEHISSYSLIIEEGTPFFLRYGDTPPVDEDTDRWMYERTGEVLEAAGFGRYEISNYAIPERECIHNLKYWRRQEYVGLGLGAASFLPCGDNRKRISNVREMENYTEKLLLQGELPLEGEGEILTPEEERGEFMYLGLRCMEGISLADFADCFGEPLMVHYGKEVEFCKEQGLMEEAGGFLRLTRRGIDVSNRVFSLFV